MPIKIKLDDKLRAKIGGEPEITVNAETVHEALFEVAVVYPALHLFNCDGELRSILKIAMHGLPARVSDRVIDGDTVELSIG